jgi:hypothetical protein
MLMKSQKVKKSNSVYREGARNNKIIATTQIGRKRTQRTQGKSNKS